MALFEVPGWSVPSAPVQEAPKARKRKRSAAADNTDEKIQTAQINVEKLLKKFNKEVASGPGDEPTRKKRKNRNNGKAGAETGGTDRKDVGKQEQKQDSQGDRQLSRGAQRSRNKQKRVEQQKNNASNQEARNAVAEDVIGAAEGNAKKRGPRAKNAQKSAAPGQGTADPKQATISVETVEEKDAQNNEGLTALQVGMKSSLEGARFRWINEQLYKTDSSKALEMMRQNPRIFSEYHTGFRHQVSSWPSNPVSHYIERLSSYPPKTVIADLGAGDAALARALVPQNMIVLSYDLVADGKYVVEADTCSRLPLPGSENCGSVDVEDEESESQSREEEGVKGDGAGGIVDVVVCALSLMGINWPGTIREAWRVLQPGGELMIAEVASRFTDVVEFAGFVTSFGFKLKKKDDSNTHFTLFEFKKVARLPKTDKEWSKMLSRGNLLKPCEYKRR